MSDFEQYLADALDHALRRADEGTDNGELTGIVEMCGRGVVANHRSLEPDTFMLQLAWCVGSQRKDYDVRIRERPGGSFWERQKVLFRSGDPQRIVAEATAIQREFSNEKRYLPQRMVDAVLSEATDLVDATWPVYRDRVLPLPEDPESENLDDWLPAVQTLVRLPLVGPTTAWYLLRNLLGAPVFKPDIHILAIAWHYFGLEEDPLASMTAATRELWPRVCASRAAEERVLCPHLGVVDFILWWYRRETGHPAEPAHEPPASHC